jgi:hypothetical protein
MDGGIRIGARFLMVRMMLGVGLLAGALPMAAATYYVDAARGSDAKTGLSEAESWKTLAAVNGVTLGPGDAVLFHAGQVWRGTLAPKGRGAAGRVIRIGKFGEGAMPRIEGDGENAVELRNMDEVEVSELEVTNVGDGTGMRRGECLQLWEFGVARHIVLRHLFVHDVGGTLEKKDSGGIVFQAFGKTTASRFDDLVIERNVVLHVDRSGIMEQTDRYMRKQWVPSTGVVIRENYVADVGGDGIVPLGTSHVLVEGNVVRRAGARSTTYNAGVWPWSSDDALFRWNDVAETGGTKDGEGFDSDYNSHGTRFEHNYSHDNAGGFMLICTPGVASGPYDEVGNVGTRVVGNISRGDHARVFNISGGTDILIEKNLIVVPREVVPKDAPMQVVLFTEWNGFASDVLVRENRIFIEGKGMSGSTLRSNVDGTFQMGPGWGKAEDVRFEGNVYLKSGRVEPMEADAKEVKSMGLEGIDWEGPGFDAVRDGGRMEMVDAFFVAHGVWLRGMFQRAGVM